MRRAIVLVGVLAAALLVLVPPAVAQPRPASFTVVEQFEQESGVFTSDGSIVCASGTTSNETFGSGFQSDRGVIFHVRKTITCDDGSGSFTLQLQARAGFNVGDMTSGPWVVLRGTGDYATLRGQGTVTGTFTPGGVIDAYTGWLMLR